MGPRCADGVLLKERKLYRQDCDTDKLKEEPVLPGCESEIIDTSQYGTSEVFSPWMEKIREQSQPVPQIGNNVQMAPSPEESEYFYDEYVDYPFNDTSMELGNSTKYLFFNRTHGFNSTPAYHFIPGDTPTLYAGHNPNKTHSNAQYNNINPGTGFTFFGMPLPSLNIGKLWGSQRKTERKMQDGRPRDSGRLQAFPPSQPDVQSGGFVPLTPGASGGFQPISDPSSNMTYYQFEREKSNIKVNQSSWPSDFPSVTGADEKSDKIILDPGLGGASSAGGSDKGALFNSPLNSNLNESVSIEGFKDSFGFGSPGFPKRTIFYNRSITVKNDQFPPPFGETITNRDSPGSEEEGLGFKNIINPLLNPDKPIKSSFSLGGLNGPSFFSPGINNSTRISFMNNAFQNKPPLEKKNESSTEEVVTFPTAYINHQLSLYGKDDDEPSASPTAILVVPGGNQSQYNVPIGRKSATITKVEHPNTYTDNTQIPSSIEPYRANSRGGKTSFNSEYEPTTKSNPFNSSLSWYYMNYNQSGLEPYVGPGVEMFGSNAAGILRCDILGFSAAFLVFLRTIY